MTHLAIANEKGKELTTKQLASFKKISNIENMEKTISNSAAVINYPEAHLDWVRPGLMLYGV